MGIDLHSVRVSLRSLRVFINTELVIGGDLFNALIQCRKPFPENEVRSVTRQLVSAVAHCHARRVAHRDIKLENILASCRQPIHVKLADFGSATLLQEATHVDPWRTSKTMATTEHYTAPEVFRAINAKQPYDAFKLDAFSIGIVTYVLVCNTFPESTKQEADFKTHPLFLRLSADGRAFVKSLLCQDPRDRMGVDDSQTHNFIKSLGEDSTIKNIGRASSPAPFDAEMQCLLALQVFIKGLQRQRGASCWVLKSYEGRMPYQWRCQFTAQKLELAQTHLENLQGDCWESVREALAKTAEGIRSLQRTVGNAIDGNVPITEETFDYAFSTYSRVVHIAIEALNTAIAEVLKPLRRCGAPSGRELQLKLLLLISEQLGRERAFVIAHIDKPEQFQSLSTRLRFARIQGARETLLGTSSSRLQYDVVSSAGVCLPSLLLTNHGLLSDKELAELEEAEMHVIAGEKGTSEWWSIITKLIDTTHSRMSLGLVEAVQHAAAATNLSPNTAIPSESLSDGGLAEESNLDSTPSDVASALGDERGATDPVLGETSLPKEDGHPDLTDGDTPYPLQDMIPTYTPWSCFSPQITPMEDHYRKLGPQFYPNIACVPPGVPFVPQNESPIIEQAKVAPTGPVESVGTIGHPLSCSKLGCKFAARCKDGASCTRCHLCVWTRVAARTKHH